MLPLFAAIVAASTAVLIFAGGMVTSTGSGLSVPDWPNTYGWFMFSFPVDKWVGGIFYEHSHRLIASTVGFLIMVLAFWLWRAEPRAWVRRLGFIALGAVITQGILGGITVLWYLPGRDLDRACEPRRNRVLPDGHDRARRRLPAGSAATRPAFRTIARCRRSPSRRRPAIYLQILLGATMRHTDAGLAIPDFPLAFGHLIPPHWDAKIAIHFAHRVGALIVTTMILATTGHVLYHHRRRAELRRPSMLLLALLPLQITLGALTVWSGRQPLINSIHVVTGASVLVTSLVLTLRAHRARFNEGALGVRVPRVPPRDPDTLRAHAGAGARA